MSRAAEPAVKVPPVAAHGAMDRAVAASRDLLSLARLGEWETLSSRIAERDAALRAAAEPGAAPASDRSTLVELRALNDEILALAGARRAALARDLTKFRRGQAASRQYGALAPPRFAPDF